MKNIIAAAILGGSLIVGALIVSAPKPAATYIPPVTVEPAPVQMGRDGVCPEGQVWYGSSNAWGGRCDWPTVKVAP